MEESHLEVRLFGEFAVLRSGVELATPRPKRARILVGLLALNPGRTYLRCDLAEHLWPDSDAAAARFNLRQLLSQVRRTAPELARCLVASRETLCFESTGVSVDAVEFRRLATVAPDRAVALYIGPLLARLDDPWLETPRAEFEALYLRALEALADGSSSRDAVLWLRRALATDALCEPLQQKLILRLAECGDIAGVRRAYREFAHLLHVHLNAAPSEDTSRLVRAIVSRPPVELSLPPNQELRSRLPVPLTEMLGRETELSSLTQMLLQHRWVTVIGPGGSGKTRLSIAVGAELETSTAGGVWFVDLSTVHDASRVSYAVAHALGLQESLDRDRTEALVDCVGAGERIIIFDNCEHVVDACAALGEDLLGRCPRLKILATSRIPVGVTGEQRFALLPLELPEQASSPADAEAARRYSALRLFEARARLVAPAFELNARNVGRVAAVCRDLDGLPLAIEMAAARLGALALDRIAERVASGRLALRNPSRKPPPRHRSLGAVIEWGFDLLPVEAQVLFRRLAVFAGGWTLDAAEYVAGFGEALERNVLESLVTLIDASLVQVGDDRYRYLETIAEFARARAGEGADILEVRRRHRDWFLDFAAESAVRVRGREQARWLRSLDAEAENLRLAVAWSLDSEHTLESLRLCGALWRFWQAYGNLEEGRRWCLRAASLDGAPDYPAERAAALNGAAALARDQGDYAGARMADAEALSIYRSIGKEDGLATSMIGLGIVEMQTGDYEAAWLDCQGSLTIRRRLGDQWGIASALNNLGLVATCQGKLDLALDCHRQAMELSRRASDDYALARSLTNIGRVALARGDYVAALANHDESTVLRRALGDRSGLARSLCQLGLAATLAGEEDLARASLAESLAVSRATGDRRCVADNLDALATREVRLGRPRNAVLFWGAAAAHRQAIGSARPPDDTARIQADMAYVRALLTDGEFAAAYSDGEAISLDEVVTAASIDGDG